MDWRLKCLVMHALDHMPMRQAAHKLLQRYFGGRYFQTLTPALLSAYSFHVENFKRLPAGSTVFEFGAGRNLLAPLLLSNAGASRLIAADLERIATLEQINHMILQLKDVRPGKWPMVSTFDDLARFYRIEYRAPFDARTIDFADGSIDFIYSTSTLEHIPPEDIGTLLRECKRVLSSQGLMSFLIDYHDHYASADRSISMLNFYQFSDRQWRLFNPGSHYQNRLRHCDHERIFAELGLSPLINSPIIPEWANEALKRTSICGKFRHYAQKDLATSNGFFLLRDSRHHHAAISV